jgi:hypothetical protein
MNRFKFKTKSRPQTKPPNQIYKHFIQPKRYQSAHRNLNQLKTIGFGGVIIPTKKSYRVNPRSSVHTSHSFIVPQSEKKTQ